MVEMLLEINIIYAPTHDFDYSIQADLCACYLFGLCQPAKWRELWLFNPWPTESGKVSENLQRLLTRRAGHDLVLTRSENVALGYHLVIGSIPGLGLRG
jgi:hypothetical protein